MNIEDTLNNIDKETSLKLDEILKQQKITPKDEAIFDDMAKETVEAIRKI
jgi:hypothetical protein